MIQKVFQITLLSTYKRAAHFSGFHLENGFFPIEKCPFSKVSLKETVLAKNFLLYQSVWRIKKVQLYHTPRYSEASTEGRVGFIYSQKHKKICIFLIYNPDFENSTQHLAIYIILVKIIFFVHKAALAINVLYICYSICCSYGGMS